MFRIPGSRPASDSSEAEFEHSLHSGSEHKDDAGELSPIEKFVAASKAKWGRRSAIADTNAAVGKPNLSPIERFAQASDARRGRRSADVSGLRGIDRFVAISKARHSGKRSAGRKAIDAALSPIEKFVAASKARWARE
jgi:hypothetical protein